MFSYFSRRFKNQRLSDDDFIQNLVSDNSQFFLSNSAGSCKIDVFDNDPWKSQMVTDYLQ